MPSFSLNLTLMKVFILVIVIALIITTLPVKLAVLYLIENDEMEFERGVVKQD